VGRLRANVFEDEGECLQTTRSDVEFGSAIFVQDGRDTSEGWKR
jgi:hypothetical protein